MYSKPHSIFLYDRKIIILDFVSSFTSQLFMPIVFFVSFRLIDGYGVRRDYLKALRYFQLAAHGGKCILGFLFVLVIVIFDRHEYCVALLYLVMSCYVKLV